MSSFEDPPRLFEADDAPAELRSLLAGAHADGLGADAAARVAAGVESQLIGPAGPSGVDGGGSSPASPGASSTSSLSTSAGTKLGAAVAVAALALGAWWWVEQSPPEPLTMAERQPTTTLPVPTEAVGEPAAEDDNTATEEPPADRPGSDAPGPAQASSPGPRRAGASSTAAPEDDKDAPQDVVEEHRLLRAARASLDSNPRRALALTEEHRRRFPQGMLVQEREVIAIEALAKLGKSDSARSRADQFAEDYPDSPHRGRVDGTSPSGAKKAPRHP